MGEKYQEKRNNTKVENDLAQLANAFTSYKEAEKKLPDPIGNKNYFTADGMYNHSGSGAFWVHGFITSETLPKKYLNFVPVDIKTNQYYAFGKTLDNTWYEVAWVMQEGGTYYSKVYGDYSWENGPYNLIREYNGPSFVANDSTINFPYNPEEKLLTARISVFSWSITINGTTLTDEASVTSTTLRQGDEITVSSGWYAQIYYSDGSSSTLWDDSSASTITLSNMAFVEDNNLYTQIKLTLHIGSLWTNATTLDSKSDFEVYTTDTSAAVRGTIFWVSKAPNETNITVNKWKVEVKKVSEPLNTTQLSQKLVEEEAIWVTNVSSWGTGGIPWYDSSTSILEAIDSPVGITIPSNTGIPTSVIESYQLREVVEQDLSVLIERNVTGYRCWEESCSSEELLELVGQGGGDASCLESQTHFDFNSDGSIDPGECIENSLSWSGYNLMAYAAYDNYSTTWLNFNTLYWLYSTGGTAFNWTHWQMIQSLWNACTPEVDWNKFENSNCDDTGSNWSISWWSLHWFWFNGYSHIMSNWTTKWVFIDNFDNDSYIKYTWLNLWSDFAIEMSVRGAALNRPSTTSPIISYQLLNLWSVGYLKRNMNWTGAYNPNDFYKVTFINSENRVFINWVENITLFTKQSWALNPSDNLYIWSSSFSTNQWNDIIDYVKIYTRD